MATPSSTPAPSAPSPTPTAAPVALSDVVTVDPGALVVPDGVQLEGEPVAAIGWTDQAGKGLAVLTRSSSQDEADGTESVGLFAYSILVEGPGAPRVLRTVQDGVEACPLDTLAAFVAPGGSDPDGASSGPFVDPQAGGSGTTQGPLLVTDLDDDGTAEVSFAYATACRGDVSPADLKELVLEGDRKYIIRGQSFLATQATRELGADEILTGKAEPAPDAWPAGVYEPTAARYASDALLAELPG